ncbi:MAG: hypothetical protein AAFU54_18765 [Chloroflexota bacterium]
MYDLLTIEELTTQLEIVRESLQDLADPDPNLEAIRQWEDKLEELEAEEADIMNALSHK